MKIILLSLLGIIVIGIAVFMEYQLTATPHTEKKVPQQTSTVTQKEPMKIIGWIPNWDQDTALQTYATYISDFQYISVFWYRLDSSGNITTYQSTDEDPSILALAHSHQEKVFALVANLPDYNEHMNWDADRVQKVINSEQSRQKHIADLVNLVTSKNFDGLDIDYESLHAYQRDDFSVFIQELAAALHSKNKLLGVAVYPQTADTNSQDDYGAQAQNLPALAQEADQLYFMTYLESTLSSPPGPTGGTPWIRDSMKYAINVLHIPREKIFMGIGLMGVAWRQNPDGSVVGDRDDITFQEILSIAQNNQITPSWDTDSQSPFLEFTDGNGKHIIWFENSQSVADKITLANDFQVGGIAFWRLGGEDPAVWQEIPN